LRKEGFTSDHPVLVIQRRRGNLRERTASGGVYVERISSD